MTQAGKNPKDSSLGFFIVIGPNGPQYRGVWRIRFSWFLDPGEGVLGVWKEVIQSSQSVIYRGELYLFFYQKA
jgi:hypothetical protein